MANGRADRQGHQAAPDLHWAGDLAAMIQVSLIGFWVGGSFLSFAYWDYPMVLVALLVAMRAVLDCQTVADTVTGEIRLKGPMVLANLDRALRIARTVPRLDTGRPNLECLIERPADRSSRFGSRRRFR